jgi:hypothetical protein
MRLPADAASASVRWMVLRRCRPRFNDAEAQAARMRAKFGRKFIGIEIASGRKARPMTVQTGPPTRTTVLRTVGDRSPALSHRLFEVSNWMEGRMKDSDLKFAVRNGILVVDDARRVPTRDAPLGDVPRVKPFRDQGRKDRYFQL